MMGNFRLFLVKFIETRLGNINRFSIILLLLLFSSARTKICHTFLLPIAIKIPLRRCGTAAVF